MDESQGERILQQQFGTIKKAAAFYNNQVLDHLNLLMREFITRQYMMFISTADGNGNCDASFRAGDSGFVIPLNETTLIYPEYKGNGVMASMGNVTENPHIGLLFIDFTDNQIGLHVNGKASIYETRQLFSLNHNKQLLEEAIIREGEKAERWIVVNVEEAYIHCSKHIPRMDKLDKEIAWGTDDEKKKSGDFFKAKHNK